MERPIERETFQMNSHKGIKGTYGLSSLSLSSESRSCEQTEKHHYKHTYISVNARG